MLFDGAIVAIDDNQFEQRGQAAPARGFWRGLKSGWRRRCPRCGARSLFSGYVVMATACGHCGLELEPYRADDAPAYFTILITGHIVVPMVLLVEQAWQPELWVHALVWVPLTLGLSLGLLPFVKGAVIGAQWGLNMRVGEMRSDERL